MEFIIDLLSIFRHTFLWLHDHLDGLVVKASTSRVADLGFNSHFLLWDFSGSSHTSDLKIVTPEAALPGTWRHRVSIGTGWPGVSILSLVEIV